MTKSKSVTTRETLFKKALREAADYAKQLTSLEYEVMFVADAKKAVLKRIYKKYKHILNS